MRSLIIMCLVLGVACGDGSTGPQGAPGAAGATGLAGQAGVAGPSGSAPRKLVFSGLSDVNGNGVSVALPAAVSVSAPPAFACYIAMAGSDGLPTNQLVLVGALGGSNLRCGIATDPTTGQAYLWTGGGPAKWPVVLSILY